MNERKADIEMMIKGADLQLDCSLIKDLLKNDYYVTVHHSGYLKENTKQPRVINLH